MPDDPPSSDRAQDAAASATAGAARAASVPGELVLDTGQHIPLSGGGVLLGRAPARAEGDAELTPIPVDDATKSVSKTHLAIVRLADGWFAEDRHSTNGSAIVRDGAQHELVPGRAVLLRDGDDIRFGDRHARIGLG
jgi:hypothetical protein